MPMCANFAFIATTCPPWPWKLKPRNWIGILNKTVRWRHPASQRQLNAAAVAQLQTRLYMKLISKFYGSLAIPLLRDGKTKIKIFRLPPSAGEIWVQLLAMVVRIPFAHPNFLIRPSPRGVEILGGNAPWRKKSAQLLAIRPLLSESDPCK